MKRLKPLKDVKRDLHKLEAYISLVENYQTDTLEKKIIKSYACTSSLSKTLFEINFVLRDFDQPCIDRSFIINLIKSAPRDELHKLVRASYLAKIKSPTPRSSFKS